MLPGDIMKLLRLLFWPTKFVTHTMHFGDQMRVAVEAESVGLCTILRELHTHTDTIYVNPIMLRELLKAVGDVPPQRQQFLDAVRKLSEALLALPGVPSRGKGKDKTQSDVASNPASKQAHQSWGEKEPITSTGMLYEQLMFFLIHPLPPLFCSPSG